MAPKNRQKRATKKPASNQTGGLTSKATAWDASASKASKRETASNMSCTGDGAFFGGGADSHAPGMIPQYARGGAQGHPAFTLWGRIALAAVMAGGLADLWERPERGEDWRREAEEHFAHCWREASGLLADLEHAIDGGEAPKRILDPLNTVNNALRSIRFAMGGPQAALITLGDVDGENIRTLRNGAKALYAHQTLVRETWVPRPVTIEMRERESDNGKPDVAVTVNRSRVLQTMARFDMSRLLSSEMIVEEMDATVRLSEETVRQCVLKLIESGLAERPEGCRSGARLNNAGRELAGKIAD